MVIRKNVIKEGLGSRVFDIANVLFMVLLAVVTLFPVWHVLCVSISNGMSVQRGEVLALPVKITFEAYSRIFADSSIIRSYGNTIYYTVLGTAINMVMTVLCAYPLSRKDLFGKRWFNLMVVIPMFISGGLIPNFMLVNALGLIDTVWALVLPGAISTWNMIVTRTFFQGLPDALMESARIDGAGEWRTLWQIVIPLSTPIIATMTMFYAVGHWNSYFSAVIYMNQKANYPVQVILRNIVIANATDEYTAESANSSMEVISATIKYAVVMVVIAPIMCIYPFAQKYFVKGMMVGSLKG